MHRSTSQPIIEEENEKLAWWKHRESYRSVLESIVINKQQLGQNGFVETSNRDAHLEGLRCSDLVDIMKCQLRNTVKDLGLVDRSSKAILAS